MNVLSALSYPWRGRSFISKWIITFVLYISVIGWIPLVGYFLQIIENVSAGEDDELPAFSDFGHHITRGFITTIAFIAYLLPGIIISFVVFAIISVISVGLTFTVGLDQEIGQGLSTLIQALLYLFWFVYFIIAYSFFIVGAIRYGASGDQSSLWQLTTNIRMMRSNPGVIGAMVISMLLVYILYGVISTILMFTFVGVCLIPFLTGYFYLVLANVLGQFARLPSLAAFSIKTASPEDLL